MQELLANYAYYTYGVRTVSYRISAPVGPRMNPKTIIPVFMSKALAGENIVLFGKGTRKQTFVHVTDIAQAIYKAIISKKAQGVYNLASHNLISNKELAELCIKITDSSSKIVFSDQTDPADDCCWDVSLDKIKADTGYEPIVGIEEMLLELKNYYLNNN
jgi:nucleoside-diphosphate-sugar epimerase